MKVEKHEKKKFIVIGQFDRKNALEALAVQAETRDVACHLAEIKNGWGTFIACDEEQARKLVIDIRDSLKK